MRSCVRVYPSEARGTIEAPPSKSYAQRAVAAALLSCSSSVITNFPSCDDSEAALRVAGALGAHVECTGTTVFVKPGAEPVSDILHCGESGLCIRMFTPISALFKGPFSLAASGSLRRREMRSITEPLSALGATCKTSMGMAPIMVSGPLKGGEAVLDSSVTSQFLTGLLFALPLAERNSTVTAEKLRSVPYVQMTLSVLEHCGVSIEWNGEGGFVIPSGQEYRLGEYRVEGDWSGAAFILVAGAVSGEVTVKGLNLESFQGDMAVLRALELSGAEVHAADGTITVKRGKLKPFEFCVSRCPDLAPPLAALAACCPGVSHLTGTSALFHKESDRASAIESEFGKAGVAVRCGEDFMEISGGRISGGSTDSRGDHRIAMALASMALVSENGIEIQGVEAVAKSYPGFFSHLRSLGVRSYE